MLNFKIEVKDIIFGLPQNLILDGDGDPPAGDPPAGDPPAGDPPAGDPPADDVSFSQEQVNTLLADQKRKMQTKSADAIKQLDNMKKTAGFSKTQKEQIEKQLSTLQGIMETDKQRVSREKAAQQEGHAKQVASLTAERDDFKNRYTTSTIKRSIADAATGNKAIHTKQVLAILEPNTTLEESVDAEGNGTGKFVPTVKFTDVDKDGNAVEINYTPAEAVKRMTELSDYSNLFESTNVGGAGRKNDNLGTDAPKDLKQAASSNESWLIERKKLGLK